MENLSRLVVLISGSGTNLQAIMDACMRHVLPAKIVAVVSNNPGAYGVERARSAGISVLIMKAQINQEREIYDLHLANAVAAFAPDWIVLVGWMRLLTMHFLGQFKNRVINLHPALPGSFPGAYAIERAYKAWTNGEINKTGVMVHLVPDEGVDTGPVLGMREIFFQEGETFEQFEKRVHDEEHSLIVETLVNIAKN